MFQPFELELYQSLYERDVDYNLADSGVKCLTLSEWLSDEEKKAVLECDLFYPEVNGELPLRKAIASLYPNAGPDNILVTVGASQANLLVAQTLLAPGDEVLALSPAYRQIHGLAKNLGCVVKTVSLNPDDNWSLDVSKLVEQISPKTKLISIVNPNNPTGAILDEKQRSEIVSICKEHDIWLHADEVYGGTETEGKPVTPSFWCDYEKLVCVNSLSKAYGLAGLRIGWIVAQEDTIQGLWRRHEYSVISASAPSMKLATFALQKEKRDSLFDRQRQLTELGHGIMSDWIETHSALFSWTPPAATGLAFIRVKSERRSHDVAEMIRQKANVLVAPGEFLGTPGYLRVAIAYGEEKIVNALDSISSAYV